MNYKAIGTALDTIRDSISCDDNAALDALDVITREINQQIVTKMERLANEL